MKYYYLFKSLLVILLVAASCSTLVAQDFTINGEIRPRAEFRDGYQTPLTTDQTPALVTLNRTRLKFDFESERINTRFTIQDSRIWGTSSHNSNNIPLTIFEGWAQYMFTPELSITVGRQTLAFDYNRLFSASNWLNEGKAHDLALLKYKNADLKVQAGFAVNQPYDVKEESLFSLYYQRLGFVRAEKLFAEKYKASAIVVIEGFQNTTIDAPSASIVEDGTHYERVTSGINFEIVDKELPLGFLLTAYYQFGKSADQIHIESTNIIHDDLNAYLLAAKLNYQVAEPANVYLGSDIYSGTDEDSEEDNTWDKLYGSNHSYNGSMEYWKKVPTAGLIDIYGGAKFNFMDKKLTADASFHFFTTQKEMSAYSDKKLGSELDIKLQYKVIKDFALECGWSSYFNSDNTLAIKGLANADTRFQQWAYIMLTINPQLFSSKSSQK